MLKWSTAQAAIFKNTVWKWHQNKIKTWRGNIKNLWSIHWDHLQLCPISWDYPFKWRLRIQPNARAPKPCCRRWNPYTPIIVTILLVPLYQCYRSKYIEFGSGSRILAQFGSGSRVIKSVLKKEKKIKIILDKNNFLLNKYFLKKLQEQNVS